MECVFVDDVFCIFLCVYVCVWVGRWVCVCGRDYAFVINEYEMNNKNVTKITRKFEITREEAFP